MVGVFRRSLSFPNKTPGRPSSKPAISHHIRSISLPCRSHPLISQIKHEINHLTTWVSSSKLHHQQTYSNLCHGLTRLKDVHDDLHDILQLPQTQESLRGQPQWVEKLLEDFLSFLDVYGIFQTSILTLKEEHSSAQMAMRKRDDSKVAMYVKAKNKMANQMEKLVSDIRCITQQRLQYSQGTGTSSLMLVSLGDAELAGVIGDVISLTVSVSIALFNGIAMSFGSRKLSWTQLVKLSRKGKRGRKERQGIAELEQGGVEGLSNLKKMRDEEVRTVLKRMQDLEGSICGIETVSDGVFQALINSRVALLNTYTQ